MIQQAIRPSPRAGVREISVEALLTWAFGAQQASLETKLEVGTKKGRRNQPREMRRSA